MTPELLERWQEVAAPFDGTAVTTCNEPDIGTLRAILMYLHRSLQNGSRGSPGSAGSRVVFTYSDWHEHDGFVVSPVASTWESVSAVTESPKTLYLSRDDDDSVRCGLYPESFEWLLRYNIDDEDESDFTTAWCDLYFSCTPACSHFGLVADLHARWPGYTRVVSAKEYFDLAHGG
jgi:hypothetical protein